MRLRKVILVNFSNTIVQWYSQTLVQSSIQEFWKEFAKAQAFTLQQVFVLPSELGKFAPLLKSADLLVFSWNGCVLLDSLRTTLNIQTPSIVYLAGEGSRGFAYSVGRTNHFSNLDLFICVSKAEQETLRLCFPKAKSMVCPYPHLADALPSANTPTRSRPTGGKTKLFYIGRYSEQKNIHTLLWALKIAETQNPSLQMSLDFFGYEDDLGSPNMQTRSSRYQLGLKNIIQTLDIKSDIHWHGFVKNEVLKNIIQCTPHILVSPSLYSEECFGLAPFDSLIRGNYCILSDWGGYKDLELNFKRQVKLVPVYYSDSGPYICPSELAKSIVKLALRLGTSSISRPPLPKPYSTPEIRRRTSQQIARHLSPKIKRNLLVKSPWISKVHRQILRLNPKLNHSLKSVKLKIYQNYSDPLVLSPFKIYGMKDPRSRHLKVGRSVPFRSNPPPNISELNIAPWVKIGSRHLQIKDPHRGNKKRVLTKGSDTEIAVLKKDSNKKFYLNQSDYLWLIERGYISPIQTSV